MPYESKGWSETDLGKRLQCVYTNSKGHTFILRQYGKHEWCSIAITVPHYGCGQIMEEGQSDTYCLNKTLRKLAEGGD